MIGQKYVALRQLSFALPDGSQLVVKRGEVVPDVAWAACGPRQVERIRDPWQRKVALKVDA